MDPGALAKSDTEEFWGALHALDTPGPEREEARARLLSAGGGVIPVLCAGLHHPAAAVRQSAAELLGEIGSQDAVAGLIRALRDRDKTVQRAAAASLGLLEAECAVGALQQLLCSGPLLVRNAAASALARIGGYDAVSALGSAARNGDPLIHRPALRALVELRAPRIGLLPELLKGADAYTRSDIVNILCRRQIGRQARTPLQDLTAQGGHAARAPGSAVEARGHPELAPACREQSSPLRQAAARALGATGLPGAAVALCRALHDPDPAVRACAEEGLERIGAPARSCVAEVLCSDDPDAALRGHRLMVLLGSTAVGPLRDLLRMGGRREQERAAAVLVEIARRSPTPDLRQVLPALDAIARRWSESSELRESCRAAVRAIESALDAARHLPLPASSPAVPLDTLPVTARAPEAEPESLPYPAASSGSCASGPGQSLPPPVPGRLRQWLRRIAGRR